MARDQRQRGMTLPETARWILAVAPEDATRSRPWRRCPRAGLAVTTLDSREVSAHRTPIAPRSAFSG